MASAKSFVRNILQNSLFEIKDLGRRQIKKRRKSARNCFGIYILPITPLDPKIWQIEPR
jgi:hypothetical protein